MTRVYVKVCRQTPLAVAALAVVAVLALAGCDDWFLGGMPDSGAREIAYYETPRPRSETTAITVRAVTPLRAAMAAGSHADVAAVTVTVAGEDAEGQYRSSLAGADLTRSDGGWSGTLSGLTVGKSLAFTARALSDANVKLFEGSTNATLDADTEAVTIGLRSVDDGSANRLPGISAITVAAVEPGADVTVQVSVTGSGSEDLDYEFTGGTFAPGSGSVTLARGSGAITSSYTAPETAGRYLAHLRVINAQGHRVEVDFEITVLVTTAPASGATLLSANLGPVVTALAGKRTPAGVRWTADVSTQGSGATYAWSFSGGGSFTDAAANPTVLTGYVATTAGTLQVTVTDGAGLSTSASLPITAGMFPDAVVRPSAELVINEIDYDTGSSDEFIEIYNRGGSSIDLTGYRFDLVNGINGTAYASYEGAGQLAGGGYFVLAKQAVFDSASAPRLLLTDNVQNGPDAIRIVETATGRVVDSVHYEGSVAGAGEGTPAGRDSGAASSSIGRCPNGFDSDDNRLDFGTMTATPGAANTCS